MKKYMKLTAALLAGAMALSLTACGGNTRLNKGRCIRCSTF